MVCLTECKVLLCDFHREQAWERWLTASANGMRTYKDITLVYLRKIAKSETEESYEKAKEELLDSELWNAEQSKKLRDWFGKTWLPQYKVRGGIVYMLVYFQ